MSSLKINGSIAYLYKVFTASLDKIGVQYVAGAIDENNLVIGIPYEVLKEEFTKDVDMKAWKTVIDGKNLVMKSSKELLDKPIEEVNKTILSKLRKYGVEAGAYITSEDEPIIIVDLESVVFQILQKTLSETKARAHDHMRTIRVAFGTLGKFSYILFYRSGRKTGNDKIEKLKNEVLKV